VIGFRPKPSALFLERPRLLRLLPEEAGYVVWLEAPYGYGKSVLTAQWAAKLEHDGWRVIWLALVEGDPSVALAGMLGLPETASWVVLLTALATSKTVVIFEDLEKRPEILESLGPLLKHTPGLVLLASRHALSTPELLRARSEGRLVHLKAEELRFTPDEAVQLFGERDSALAWNRTQGWSLPLHLAALTGDVPDEQSFWEGVRESLEVHEWRTLLTLCSLEFAPLELFPLAARLAVSGLIQVLEGGYRVHPMISSGVLQVYQDQARAALLEFAPILPPLLHGRALERLGLLDLLNKLLESNTFDFARFDPQQVLRWDQMLPLPRGEARAQQVGKSLCRVGRIEAGVAMLLESARRPDASPDSLLSAYKDAIFFLAQQGHLEQAEQLEREGLRWLDAALPEMAGRFLHNCYTIHYASGDWGHAEARLLRALSYYPESSPWRTISAGNLAIVRWHAHGDLKGLLAGRGLMLETNRSLNHSNVPGDCLQLAELHLFLGETQAARALLTEAAHYQHANPRWALEAEALLSYLNNDLDHFALLHAKVSVWADEQLIGRVRFFWARTLRLHGLASVEVVSGSTDWERIERALALNSLSELFIADQHEPMELRLYAAAARYEISRDLSHLEALIALTPVREHILPGLLPLACLPRSRPDLGFAFPIQDLLSSGWKQALVPRLDEIPLLEVRVLGRFEVRLLGQPVTLTARPSDILILLVLRLNRERIAEKLWPEADTDKSRNNLHVNLNALRKVVEPWGVPTYILESGLARARVDLWDLDLALAANDMGTVQRLYADLAPGFDLEIIEHTRANLRQRSFEAILEHANTQSSSNPTVAEATLEWLLDRDPTHEIAVRKLLELMVRSGRRHSAERRYRAFAQHLRDDVGLEPSPEITRIMA
jgi:DNA-binding SARP family transcriptional activator